MPDDRPLDLARRYIDRYNAGDLEGLLALIADDVTLQSANEPVREGIDAVRGFYEGQLAAGFQAEVLRGIDDGDEITYFEVRVTVPTGDGATVTVDCAVRQRWVDGRLVEYRNFQNPPVSPT